MSRLPHVPSRFGILDQLRLPRRSSLQCPVCGKSVRAFRPAGDPLRSDAQCPHCLALERDRLAWILLARRTSFFEVVHGRRMLHLGPADALAPRFAEAIGMGYTAMIPWSDSSDQSSNTLGIGVHDNTFDIVYCDASLENASDDLQAMRELHRVLKPGGWAVLLEPITAPSTFDASRDMPPEERERLFGRQGQMRRYGPDYAQRLRDTGFGVQVFAAQDLVSRHEAHQMGLTAASGQIHFCTK